MQGIQGAKGDRGEKGDKGDPGEKGEKGDPGNAGVVNHEELDGLLGGSVNNGHYHMEEAQHHKLDILIKALFPTGTDDIYIPYIDYRDPDNPKVLPYTPFVDLPKGTPPEWKIAALPTGYTANSSTFMYYGDFPHETYNNGLFLRYSNTLLNTTDLDIWNALETKIANSQYLQGIIKVTDDYLYSNSTNAILYKYSSTSHDLYLGYNTTPYLSHTPNLTASFTVSSAVVSSELKLLLIVGHGAAMVSGKVVSYGGVIKISKGINYDQSNAFTQRYTPSLYSNSIDFTDSIAWSPDAQVFCIAGSSGTATSANGDTWITHTDAPKNLTDLTYREDLKCFFARSLDDKKFYASGDGVTWAAVTSTPIPLSTVACVDFCQETGIYCAVGGTSEYAYFSKDLSTWVPTKITNGANITAGSVIYMPSTKKYVLMPTSGSYYYTFDPSEWID